VAKKRTKSTTSKPKLKDDALGWLWVQLFGKSKKKTSKGKGPKFSEDAIGWMIAQLRGK